MHPRWKRYRLWQDNDRAHQLGLISEEVYRYRQSAISIGDYDQHPLPLAPLPA